MIYNIAVTRSIPDVGLRLLRKRKNFRVHCNPHNRILSKEELRQFVRGADAVLSLLTDRIDAGVLDAAGPQLKIVANYAVGFDNVDLGAAKQRGVVVTNTPGALVTEAVAEHTIALMMALSHRIVEADHFTREGGYIGWDPLLLNGTLLLGKTLGIIGLGRIGIGVAKRAKGLGMQVIYFDRHRDLRFEKECMADYMPTLAAVLRRADVISLHVPLLPTTRHLISTKQFSQMKPTALLINTARGPIVDEKALLVALTKKKIAGVTLDVFECEPAIDCDIHDRLALKKMSNVILTPHIASASKEARDQMAELAAENIIAVLSGKKALHPAS